MVDLNDSGTNHVHFKDEVTERRLEIRERFPPVAAKYAGQLKVSLRPAPFNFIGIGNCWKIRPQITDFDLPSNRPRLAG